MNKKIEVKKWIYSGTTSNYDILGNCLGGFFQKGMRWKDFISHIDPEKIEYLEAIRKDVIAKGIRITGQQHQDCDDGTPLFNDYSIGIFSWRAWGDLMAAIWAEEEDKDCCYMDFYC